MKIVSDKKSNAKNADLIIREFVDNLISKYASGSNGLQMKRYTTRTDLENRKKALSNRKLVKA